MLRRIAVLFATAFLVSFASADRGLITTTGPSGLFIHPTAEVLGLGDWNISALYYEQGGGGGFTNTGMASLQYGMKKNWEIGANFISSEPVTGSRVTAEGGWLRYQCMHEDEQHPSIAVGWVQNDGTARHGTQVFGVAQKRLTPPGYRPNVNGYLGLMYTSAFHRTDTRPYVGLDMQVVPFIKLVGEWAPGYSFNAKDRSAFGLQYIGSHGVGVGLGAIQDGNAGGYGFFMSAGYTWKVK